MLDLRIIKTVQCIEEEQKDLQDFDKLYKPNTGCLVKIQKEISNRKRMDCDCLDQKFYNIYSYKPTVVTECGY